MLLEQLHLPHSQTVQGLGRQERLGAYLVERQGLVRVLE
jgi:hypothetical protein